MTALEAKASCGLGCGVRGRPRSGMNEDVGANKDSCGRSRALAHQSDGLTT
jgi:hypothetical protein